MLMRFFGAMSQAKIGSEPGVTQMQVSRLPTQILAKLCSRLSGTRLILQPYLL
jgi:DNA-directed RNA polymerase specialized sigma subunit